MLKILLYAIATFLETGIGIWFFGKMFPKRERMERRHYFAEWILYTILMITACTFPTAFFKLKDEEQYTNMVLLIYCAFLVIYIRVVWKKKKYPDMKRFLLIGMIISSNCTKLGIFYFNTNDCTWKYISCFIFILFL